MWFYLSYLNHYGWFHYILLNSHFLSFQSIFNYWLSNQFYLIFCCIVFSKIQKMYSIYFRKFVALNFAMNYWHSDFWYYNLLTSYFLCFGFKALLITSHLSFQNYLLCDASLNIFLSSEEFAVHQHWVLKLSILCFCCWLCPFLCCLSQNLEEFISTANKLYYQIYSFLFCFIFQMIKFMALSNFHLQFALHFYLNHLFHSFLLHFNCSKYFFLLISNDLIIFNSNLVSFD